jgi:hypothetical protein
LDELTVDNIYQATMYAYHNARQQLNNKMDSLASFPAAPNQQRDDGGHYIYRRAAARVQVQVNLRYVCPSRYRVPYQRAAYSWMYVSDAQEADNRIHKKDTKGTYRCTMNVFYQPRQRVVLIYRSQRAWQNRVNPAFPSQTMRTTTTLATLHGYNDTINLCGWYGP